ncbi:MAG: TonB-dependent receptor, partial [Balneolaceae bacterium]
MKFGIWLVSCVFLMCASAAGQQAQEVAHGWVVSAADDEPIPGATVVVDETARGVATDLEGFFEIRDMPSGTYTLIIRAVGYQPLTRTITLPLADALQIQLEPTVLMGGDVIVTSSPIGRNIQYQPAQSFNAETLQRNAAAGLGDILNGSPGVASRSFGPATTRPVIRGFDGDRVLVIQNGERMGDLSATAVDHAIGLDPLAMDRVEVVRGPASLLYGSSAIGGVVNMFTSDMPREWEAGTTGSVATQLSTMNNMGAGLLRVQQGDERIAASARMIYRDGGDLRTPEGRLPDTSLESLSYGAGFGYRSGNLETGFSINGMDIDYGLPEAIDDADESIEIRMNRVNLQNITTLRSDRFIELAELRVHYSDYAHDEIEIERMQGNTLREELEIRFEQQSVSSSLLLRHRPVGSLQGALGFSFNYTDLSVSGSEALTPDANGFFAAVFLFEEYRLSDRVSLSSGVRAEWKETNVNPNELFPDATQFEDRSDMIFSGAVGLNVKPAANWEIGMQLARAFRTPTIEELYSFAPHAAAGSFDIGDPTLDKEISLGGDLFAHYTARRFSGELSLFANRIDNFVDFTPTGEIHEASGLPVFEYRSKDAIVWGFEAEASLRITSDWMVTTGADFVRGRERSGERNNLTFMPPLRTRAAVMYDNGAVWAGPRVSLIDGQNRVAPNEESTSGYVLVGADAGMRFAGGLTLSLRFDNLLNERYRDHLNRVENRDAPMPGRNVNAMLRWEF